jgi:C4-dicarboxylate-specific signal transduction histidine kinase
MQRKRDTRSTAYLAYVLIILLMVGALLAWQAWSRTAEFDNFHRQLAATSVQGAADEFEVLLGELHRSMRLFASDRQALLDSILASSKDDALWNELETAVQEHFPEYFSLTLTDIHGNVLRPDFDYRVAELCQQDIHDFIGQGYQDQGVIHPNPLGYHFDIMVPWGNTETTRGVFFLSFHPAMLARVLHRLQPPGHELLLLNGNKPGLIEVTAQGSRDTLQGEFFLDPGELERITETRAIPDSRWVLADLPADGLLRGEAVRNWTYAALVFCVFVGITLLMLYQLRRKEKFRILAEERALRHQNDLAHVDRLNILGEMASGIAHELNQPLSAISTYCQSGLRIIDTFKERPEKLAHVLEASSQQAKRAGQIIHRMREFVAKGKTQHTPTNVNRVITEAVEFIAPELEHQDVTVRLDLSGDLPDIMADSIQIEQVILNLLHNAIEAMTATSGGLRELSVASRRTHADQLEIRVSDTGQGLPPDTGDRVFDTFYSTKAGGMGLGLAISRSIVEAHGGQFWTESKADAGATFCFSLPVTGIQ